MSENRIIILDANYMESKIDLHKYIERKLNLPDYYGRNLDALNDVLSEFSDELTIKIVNTKNAKKKLGEYWDSFIEVIENISEDYGKISLVVE